MPFYVFLWDSDMKQRHSRSKNICLSPDERSRIRGIRETVLQRDKQVLSRKAKAFANRRRSAAVELARAAELLRDERQSQGLSLADIRKKSGISRAAICRLENLVAANPTIATLSRLADALGKRLVIAIEDR